VKRPGMLLPASLIAVVCCAAGLGAQSTLGSFLVTNDDIGQYVDPPFQSTVTFIAVNSDGTLGAQTSVSTEGYGIGGGFFGAARVIAMPNGADACVYVSNAETGDIVGFDALKQTVTGVFYPSLSDSGSSNGIGLAANAQYLYATYTASTTIATFQVQPGCILSFVGDIFAVGLNGGTVGGMAINGNIMVIAYGDGSIQSFNISGGVPVPNSDEQYSTGSTNDHLPNGVTITSNGNYAIFGDASTTTTVEVSNISSGQLTPTTAYALGPTWNSGSVLLSPDETILYVSNDSSGQVTAAFFNSATGVVSKGCTSNTLNGFYTNFSYVGKVQLQLSTGQGGMIYVPEFGSNSISYIGMLQLTSTGATCTLTESPNSPVADAKSGAALLSIAVYPVPPL
jgi:6-phosphogluconolactonase (cycloisomerase 2 family)